MENTQTLKKAQTRSNRKWKIGSAKSVFCLIFFLCSYSSNAEISVLDDYDPAAIHDPGIADGCVVIDLPRATSAGRNLGSDCFASYYIENVPLDRKFDDRQVTYGIRVTNIGSCPLTNVVITDIFPIHAALLSAQPLPSVFRDGSVSWMLGRIETNQSYLISIGFDIKGCDKFYDGGGDLGRLVVNTACVWNPGIKVQTCGWLPTPFDKDVPCPASHIAP